MPEREFVLGVDFRAVVLRRAVFFAAFLRPVVLRAVDFRAVVLRAAVLRVVVARFFGAVRPGRRIPVADSSRDSRLSTWFASRSIAARRSFIASPGHLTRSLQRFAHAIAAPAAHRACALRG